MNVSFVGVQALHGLLLLNSSLRRLPLKYTGTLLLMAMISFCSKKFTAVCRHMRSCSQSVLSLFEIHASDCTHR